MMDDQTRAAYARFHADLAAAHMRLAQTLAPDVVVPVPLGPRQEAAVAFLGDQPEGATAKDVGEAIGVDVANTHKVLDSLVDRGLASRIDVRPRRWKVAA